MSRSPRYRYRDLPAGDLHYEAWRRYRRRGLAFIPLIPGFFVVLAGVLWEARGAARGGTLDPMLLAAAYAYFALFIVLGLRWRFSKCPRCGRAYGFNLNRPFAPAVPGWFRSACPHCGLKLWEPGEK